MIDPRVDLISFTGSTAVGRRIMEKGAPTLKRLFLELGGKSADIILDDTDFESKLSMAWTICIARWPGLRDAHPDAAAPARATTRAWPSSRQGFRNVPYGDPTDPATSRDPRSAPCSASGSSATSRRARPRVPALVVGGGRPAHLDKGYYVEPTLFADVENSMTIAQEEIFGPVLVVVPFDDDDDAVRIANENQYGLGVGVTSASEDRAMAVAARIRAGTVSASTTASGTDPTRPSVATRPAGSAARTGSRASSSTPRRRPTPASCHRWTGRQRPTRGERTPRADTPDLKGLKGREVWPPGPTSPRESHP